MTAPYGLRSWCPACENLLLGGDHFEGRACGRCGAVCVAAQIVSDSSPKAGDVEPDADERRAEDRATQRRAELAAIGARRAAIKAGIAALDDGVNADAIRAGLLAGLEACQSDEDGVWIVDGLGAQLQSLEVQLDEADERAKAAAAPSTRFAATVVHVSATPAGPEGSSLVSSLAVLVQMCADALRKAKIDFKWDGPAAAAAPSAESEPKP